MAQGDKEAAIDPGRPVIDAHLHLMDIGGPHAPFRFLLDEALATIEESGCDVTHSVFVECGQMYRTGGPADLASLGETEFANGMAAMSASGQYGPRRLCHRIVSAADLRLGERLEAVLDAHTAAAGARFAGVRPHTAYSPHGLFGNPCDPAAGEALRDPRFLAGARRLGRRGLTLDIWCLHSQLEDVIALADAAPDTTIVLDHLGSPEAMGPYAADPGLARREWERTIRELGRRANVVVKLGGLGMDLTRVIDFSTGSAPSEVLAERWRPFIDTAIEVFGAARGMFQSNFPPDCTSGSYGATWNAFKRIAAAFSDDEQDALFRRTAARIYRIDLDA